MDTKEFLGLVEAYAEVYAPQELDEISQKTATKAYATSYTGEFEGADSERDVKRTDNLRKQIKRKFGDKAAQHADRAGHAMTFGRKGAGGMPPKPTKEDFDIFDVVLEFLQAEGFAETLEEAEWMMANMIDEEAIEIVVGEGYQRNPEKGEKEDKKYAPVRGEKTPMPPRGDKRREDFEKWYAKQMGR